MRSGLRRYPRQLAESVRALAGRAAHASPPQPDAIESVAPEVLAGAWLGHASVLLHIGGRWILTDPVFSERIGMRMGQRVIGLGRLCELPTLARRLPPLDAILISHAHFDHLDRPTLQRLACADTAVITPRRTASLIPPGFRRIVELPQERDFRLRGITFRALRPRHWGARTALDRRRGVNAYIIEVGTHRVLFGGDTADTDAFDPLDGVNLAIFGIGAYDPWVHQHATPEQVWSMFQRVGAEYLMPVHHSTFPLSDEDPDEPLQRLLAVANGQSDRIVGRSLGEMIVLDG